MSIQDKTFVLDGMEAMTRRAVLMRADGRVIECVVSRLDPEHFTLHLAF